VLIANPNGLFGVYSYREVFEFDRFWAIGSGRAFALGAMHAVYGRSRSASEVARVGVAAGCEFDKNSAAPVRLHMIQLKR
jgi:ATP-dependent HslUV protease, peptidase subunit HslV